EDDAGMTLSPYAESKWMNEKQILDARQEGLNAAALRFFNVYGNGQKSDGAYSAVIPKFIDLMLNGKTPIVNGDGLQTRDFVHVEDVCTAVLSLIEDDWKAVNHHVFNVATQTKISLLDLIDTINQILVKVNHLNISIDPVFGPSREGDIQHSLADIQRMKNTFNWEPTMDFQRGLEQMIHSRKANR
ncbi:MAG: NAD-dependent epimerase/dehydratase family protein, partial [Opitutae bacterium]|nr:NAD-dependent epimerase/dehydratase family protein [Opitutae bacterium]